MSTAPIPSRGEIWLVDFDPAVGAEIQKMRPALVVSVDSVGRLPLRIVVPLTDWKPHYAGFPWFVLIPADADKRLEQGFGRGCVPDEIVVARPLRSDAGYGHDPANR